MTEILTLLQCAQEPHNKLILKRLSRVIMAMLVTSGRVTMLGLSRWGGNNCSYRTVQRMFYSSLEWGKLMWALFETHLYDKNEEYVLIGDKTVVTKAGKHTYGVDRFFSSIHKKPVSGVCFQVLALGAVKGNWACPINVSQVGGERAEKSAANDVKVKKKIKRVKKKTNREQER